jgi:hypothetical protein
MSRPVWSAVVDADRPDVTLVFQLLP